jgi:hypothetical protein
MAPARVPHGDRGHRHRAAHRLRVLMYRRYSGRRPVDLDDLMFADPERQGEPAGLRPFFAHGPAKSINAMFMSDLARRLGDPGSRSTPGIPAFSCSAGRNQRCAGTKLGRSRDLRPCDLFGETVMRLDPTVSPHPPKSGCSGRLWQRGEGLRARRKRGAVADVPGNRDGGRIQHVRQVYPHHLGRSLVDEEGNRVPAVG